MTRTQSDFGVQIDSLADVISFGIAPAILSFSWGLSAFGQAGWAAGFIVVDVAIEIAQQLVAGMRVDVDGELVGCAIILGGRKAVQLGHLKLW